MGAGAWGTALAKVLADAGNDVTLWARRQELADEINDTHRNTEYLGDIELSKSIGATSTAAEALAVKLREPAKPPSVIAVNELSKMAAPVSVVFISSVAFCSA